jgi:hypothetical protein
MTAINIITQMLARTKKQQWVCCACNAALDRPMLVLFLIVVMACTVATKL